MEPTRPVVRIRARLSLKLPMWVLCRENLQHQWTEKSRLIDVNQFGAGFTLTRPVEVGRLIQLTAPLPHQLRCFDQLEQLYSVWTLVRHCSVLQHHPVAFRLGVAFIGKHAPASYNEDPASFYEPLPIKLGQSVMWNVTRRPPAKARRETRLLIPLEVLVETLDENGKPSVQEYTVTEAISSLGACIPSSLDVEVGHVIRITSVTDRISIFGAVRSRTVMPDGIARLGIEFIADRWPLQRESSFIYKHTPLNISPQQST
ncbi:MAG TPA: hypothetical protein VN696_06565 [Pyrinomonadaceae bacterium]|nr:hypothetical protein [Pyrinomonadaceae bacterium]